jgi:AraC-like DNA-binding protein
VRGSLKFRPSDWPVTSSLESFLRAPRGRFDGAHFTFWSLGCVSGWKVWGQPEVLDGQQLVACLVRARVERAQTLLRDTDWKLTHVAQEVGFSSSQRLATAFRGVLGLTPTAFRTRARGGVARGRTSLSRS